MREIKFKAFVKSKGEVFGVRGFDFAGTGINVSFTEEIEEFVKDVYFPNKDDVELMQYTGLKDKNGVEIYEGDVVKCWWLAELGYCELNCEHKGVVRFVDCRFEVSFSDKAYIRNVCEEGVYSLTELELTCASHDEDYCIEYEVIGNIYENPELLDG